MCCVHPQQQRDLFNLTELTLIICTWFNVIPKKLKFTFYRRNSSNLKVRLGDYDISRDDELDLPYEEVSVKKIIIHPKVSGLFLQVLLMCEQLFFCCWKYIDWIFKEKALNWMCLEAFNSDHSKRWPFKTVTIQNGHHLITD